MPKHPKRLFEKYKKEDTYELPYEMTKEESEKYFRYEFARRKYIELISYLNSTNKDVNKETDERLGYGGENGVPMAMDAEIAGLLSEICGELINASNALMSMAKEQIKTGIANNKDPKELKKIGKVVYDIRENRKRAVKDVGFLESLEPDNLPSYMAMHRKATDVVIDTGNYSVETAGDALSTRYKLRYMDENGKVRQGFFTIDNEKKIEVKNQLVDVNINHRNVAMSDIATLLGMGNMLAKSTEMTMVINGEPKHGCFMENAKGIDFFDLKPDHPVLNGQPLKVNYDKVVRSATDMMVLDYICLNRDRHERNHFYQIEVNKDGNPEVVGFQGIDNDASFGTSVPAENKNSGYLPALNKIFCIHKDTADAIMKLDLDTVAQSLADREMIPEAIDACLERIKKIQDRIKTKKIEIRESFTDDDFGAYNRQVNMKSPAKSGINPINNLYEMAIKSQYNTELKKTLPDRNKKLEKYINNQLMLKANKNKTVFEQMKKEFNEKWRENLIEKQNKKSLKKGIQELHNKVQFDNRMSINVQAEKVHKLYKKLWSPKDKDIPEYKDMYKKMGELDKKLSEYAKLSKEKPLNDMQQNKLAEMFSEVEKSISEYVPAISIDPSRNDMKRISISSAIQEICVTGKEQRERAVNELNDLMLNAGRSLTETDNYLKKKEKKYELEPNNPELLLAKEEMKAKYNLASYIGQLTNPDGIHQKQIKKDITTLVIAEKFKQIEKNDPELYKTQIAKFGTKNNTLEDITKKLLKNKDFNKMVSNIQAGQALTHEVQDYLLNMVSKTNNMSSVIKENKKEGPQAKGI